MQKTGAIHKSSLLASIKNPKHFPKKHKKVLDNTRFLCYHMYVVNLRQQYADMAELADALASGASGSNLVEVQVLLSAPLRVFL